MRPDSVTNSMRSVFLLSCAIMFTSTLWAQDVFRPLGDPAVFRKMADDIAKNTRTIQCDFAQEKHLSFMEAPVISSGKFYFSSDNRLRWEYLTPFSYIILMNGDQLTIIDEGMRSDMAMSENPGFKKVQKLLGTVLRGDLFAAESEFSMEFLENNMQYRIHLTPKQEAMRQYVTGMDLFFDKSDMMLAAYEMYEQGGDKTRTVFSKRSFNQPLPPGIFNASR